jgi:hypothetical protein
MLFEVRRQRLRGLPIPKRELNATVPVRGDLRVQEGPAQAMGRRVCRVATLHALDRTIEDQLLPALHDVSLLWMAPVGMVLGGIEFENGVGFLQSWHCVPWDRSLPLAGRPRHLAAHESVGHGRNAERPEIRCDTVSALLAPEGESVGQHKGSTAELACANKAAVSDSNSS